MRRSITIFIFLLTFGSARQLLAQQVIYAGIPRENFNYYASSQHNSNWCWAASLQMIFNYYGINISQEQIVARSYGIDPNGELPNWTGNFEVITGNLNNWSVDNNGRQYAVRATFNMGAPTPAYLIQQLWLHRPVLIGYQSGPNTAHAVVITACSYIESDEGPIIQTLIVRDPWPSEVNVANEGRVVYRGFEIANSIQAHWYIVIQ